MITSSLLLRGLSTQPEYDGRDSNKEGEVLPYIRHAFLEDMENPGGVHCSGGTEMAVGRVRGVGH